MKGELTAVIEPAPEGGFWAICLEIPGANGQGESIEQAKQDLQAALVRQRLEEFPAVALLGPRQVGKTTLALQLTKTLPSLDLDLESTALRQRFTCRRPGRHGAGKVPRSG
jgi:hypothetical protein